MVKEKEEDKMGSIRVQQDGNVSHPDFFETEW